MMAKKKRFKKCDFVVDQNNKVGQVRSVKRQKVLIFLMLNLQVVEGEYHLIFSKKLNQLQKIAKL